MFALTTPNVFPLNNVVGTLVQGADSRNIEFVMIAGRPLKWQRTVLGYDVEHAHVMAQQSRDRRLAAAGVDVDFDGLSPSRLTPKAGGRILAGYAVLPAPSVFVEWIQRCAHRTCSESSYVPAGSCASRGRKSSFRASGVGCRAYGARRSPCWPG